LTFYKKFWDDKANHKAFFDWLATELKIQTPEDWSQVTLETIANHGGASLLVQHYANSPRNAINGVSK
jgi:hypothetical protein